jgi:hypothetical protein
MADSLFELLPAVYREADADQGDVLRALLALVEREAEVLDVDIEALYDDFFVETAREWVIPYIGDLVGNDLLYDPTRQRDPDTAKERFGDLAGGDLRPRVAAPIRADVARTIFYRRRKGTVPMLEQLARDVTGWAAHVVEFFGLLGWTQHLEHRRSAGGWVDVRSTERMERVGGAFDDAAHTVDVRPPSQFEGWYGVPHVGFFLWRLRAYPLVGVPARPAGGGAWTYHVSPLGNPAPLFARARPDEAAGVLATEDRLPAPIRRAAFRQDVGSFYGDVVDGDRSIFVTVGDTDASAAEIRCSRLDPWPAAQPSGRVVCIDPVAGRLAVGDGWPAPSSPVTVAYHYGFSADLGGGTYDRRAWTIVPQPALPGADPPRVVTVSGDLGALETALAEWQTASPAYSAVIRILDSGTYTLPATISLAADQTLALEAETGVRPLLRTAATGLEVAVSGVTPGETERNAELTLSGVVVEGFVHVTGDLGRLRLLHATLVPGRVLGDDGGPSSPEPSLVVEAGTAASPLNAQLLVEAAFAITGPLAVPETAAEILLLDCIVDGLADDPGGGDAVGAGGRAPKTTIERSTILGRTTCSRLEASETIFVGPVDVSRRQHGCVRFSYAPLESTTPRRYRCQPEIARDQAVAIAEAATPPPPAPQLTEIGDDAVAATDPSFTERRYGQPGYAQLRLGSPAVIRTGAADGSEQGAFCHLKQPQREDNLRRRLREYLPFGLEAGVIYVT